MDQKRKEQITNMALSYFRANLDDARDAMDEPDIDFPSEKELLELTENSIKR
jgi:hypothetical protein